ncbi:DUF4180 domain-containing protein [Paenibacillus sp. MMS18-CY102]|uniref:DUF4180 domain-containing protein n=1 Tax=Paenibacillus sp. MMS18-CY102 TaxID=2682849 RepID=UPI001365AE05|nr:DUF4180 domain-containing protein [Paenibacillus sp. MMS18-CY102]MWC27675.1 DUF4180 domain-containing protein [Paenibacillus sp. MMS18-CY102]
MNIAVNEKNGSKVAVISSDGLIISNVGDALDLLADVHYNHGCDKMLVKKENIVEDFFQLSTGLAGEILQKYTNYQMAIAIVGEFSGYNSKSLNDFIYECNQGNKVAFRSTEAEALEALHNSR